jgi:hypothetical protein
VEQGIADALQRHVGRGVAVVLSDFLTFGDLQGTFNRLFSVGLEPFAVQILGPTELNPELAGDVRLLDSESGEQLDVSSVASLIDIYHECLDDLRHELRALCRSRSGRFMRIASDAPLDWVLFDQMRRKGWLA